MNSMTHGLERHEPGCKLLRLASFTRLGPSSCPARVRGYQRLCGRKCMEGRLQYLKSPGCSRQSTALPHTLPFAGGKHGSGEQPGLAEPPSSFAGQSQLACELGRASEESSNRKSSCCHLNSFAELALVDSAEGRSCGIKKGRDRVSV